MNPPALVCAWLLTLGLAAGGGGAPAAAQEPAAATVAPSPAVDPLTPAEIQKRRDALGGEVAALATDLAALPDPSAERDTVAEVRRRLLALDELLRQEQTLAEAAAARGAKTASETSPTPHPLSPFALNELLEKQLSAEGRLTARSADLAGARDALAAAKEHLEESKRGRRAARQALQAAADPAAHVDLERSHQLAEVAVRAATERVNLSTLELHAAQRKLASTENKLRDLAAAIEQMRADLRQKPADSAAGLAELTRREGDLRREREALQRALATAELRLDAAQRRFAKVAEPPNDLLEEVELLTLRRDVQRQEIAALDAQVERMTAQRDDWERWERVLRNRATRQDLRDWQEAAEEKIESIQREELQRQGRSADIRQQLEDIDTRLAALPENTKARRFVEERRALLSRLLDLQAADDRDLAANRRIAERLVAELRDRRGHFDVVDYAQRTLAALRAGWRYELTSVEEDPITLGSLITALLLAVVGFLVSRRIADAVGRLASERFHLDRGAAAALQTLAFYVFLASFTLLALRAVSFPLTAFTVLGGALAIGVGFGSQNVMNNFISGLILMLERPIRALDLVEIDGNHGTVEQIGARSTQIRSTDGRHIIVPNSFFLESNVVNWTLSDDLIRALVRVGVVYGSPTRLVERLIHEIVVANQSVLKSPQPLVIFEDFGDSALIFDAYFWVRARNPTQVRKVQSDVRFRIDEVFREHGLVIAFPQRDVHVDTTAPLEIRLVDPSERPARRSDDERGPK